MNTREFSSKQEQRVAKNFGGKVVANSGATRFNKGDVKIGDVLVECKTSVKEKDSFSIKKEWLKKNKEEAFEMGLSYSVLAIDFGSEDDYFIIDKELFGKLLEKISEE